jgi:hypothetical protein
MCVRMVPFPTEPEEARRPFAGESPYESIGDPSDTGDDGGRTTDTCLLPGVASLVCDGDGAVRIRGAAPDRLPSGPPPRPGLVPRGAGSRAGIRSRRPGSDKQIRESSVLRRSTRTF